LDKTVILIDGEDDLAVLPVLLMRRLVHHLLRSTNEGLVQVFVTEENKEKAYQLAQSFDKS